LLPKEVFKEAFHVVSHIERQITSWFFSQTTAQYSRGQRLFSEIPRGALGLNPGDLEGNKAWNERRKPKSLDPTP
jgi:hypothetical protein